MTASSFAATLSVVFLIAFQESAIAQLQSGMGVKWTHDSNVTNAQDGDVRADNIASAHVELGHGLFLENGQDSFLLSAAIAVESFSTYSGLSNVSPVAEVSFRHKFGLGALAPIVRITASATRLAYRDDVRRGWLFSPGIGLQKRLNSSLAVSGDLRWDRRTADRSTPSDPTFSGDVFNQKSRSLRLAADYDITDKTAIRVDYERRSGDAAVTVFREKPGLDDVTKAEAADPAFGPDAVVYKINAVSNIYGVNVSRAIGDHSSLNLGYRRQLSYAPADNNYYRNFVTLEFLLDF